MSSKKKNKLKKGKKKKRNKKGEKELKSLLKKNPESAFKESIDSAITTKLDKLPKTVEELTRYLSDEEREKIDSIRINDSDLESFMEMLKRGLIRAASAHDAAVQDNFALRAETTIKLSRRVFNSETGEVDELIGEDVITGQLRGAKVYKPDAAEDGKG